MSNKILFFYIQSRVGFWFPDPDGGWAGAGPLKEGELTLSTLFNRNAATSARERLGKGAEGPSNCWKSLSSVKLT
jgi:hypothetical protein